MDVLKFLQGDNQTPNPEYNPKTKEGAIQPPTLVDYNPGTSISDRGRGLLLSLIHISEWITNGTVQQPVMPQSVYRDRLNVYRCGGSRR